MPGHRFQHQPATAPRPLPGSGPARRVGSPFIEAALDLQRRAGNRSVAEVIGGADQWPTPTLAASTTSGGSLGVQREPCTDCPEAGVPPTPDSGGLPEPDAPG